MAEVGFIGMDELKANLLRFQRDLSGPGLRAALNAGAEVFKSALESAAPVGRESYTYQYGKRTVTVKNKRRIGQARQATIIYQRKSRALSEAAEELSLLIGFSKKEAFYMYWYEYGTRKQAARPFARPVFDSMQGAALEAAAAAASRFVRDI